MRSTSEIKDNFACHLRECLKSRYGKLPSAAVVARDFNLRAHGTSPISQESARRWIRGVSLPEEDRLRVLVNWLNLDFNNVLISSNNKSVYLNSNHQSELPSNHPNRNGHLKKDEEIITLIFSLDDQEIEALRQMIKVIFNKNGSQRRTSTQ